MLAKIVRSAITKQNIPESGDITTATAALKISKEGVKAAATGGIKSAGNMHSIMSSVCKGQMNQEQAAIQAQKLGRVITEADDLKTMKKPFLDGLKSWVEGAKARSEMVRAGVKAATTVAVLDSQTQREVAQLHRGAQFQAQVNQSAINYGELHL